MRHWIFQGNPDRFDIDTYLAGHDQIRWTVLQEHLATDMNPGDEVFLWRARGSTNEPAGVVAQGELLSEPEVMREDPTVTALWYDSSDAEKEALRVDIQLQNRCLERSEVVKRKWLSEDPILADLRILKLAVETNYAIGSNEAARIAELVRNTGRDWTREESLAGLWAFDQTYGGGVSKRPGEPVAQVAVAIGRAVGGVYNKVMNFRYLDGRDGRKGLSGNSRVDEEVWEDFFDSNGQAIESDRLNTELEKLWGQPSSQSGGRSKPAYGEFGEAPDDDPNELYRFATRVRRGQPQFRNNLLRLYDERCAVTGTGPPEVLEAAHIVRHSESGVNKSDNGLLLRADIHYLMDGGLLTIDPGSLEIEVDDSLAGTPYAGLEGQKLRGRTDGSRPAEKYLARRLNQ